MSEMWSLLREGITRSREVSEMWSSLCGLDQLQRLSEVRKEGGQRCLQWFVVSAVNMESIGKTFVGYLGYLLTLSAHIVEIRTVNNRNLNLRRGRKGRPTMIRKWFCKLGWHCYRYTGKHENKLFYQCLICKTVAILTD